MQRVVRLPPGLLLPAQAQGPDLAGGQLDRSSGGWACRKASCCSLNSLPDCCAHPPCCAELWLPATPLPLAGVTNLPVGITKLKNLTCLVSPIAQS